MLIWQTTCLYQYTLERFGDYSMLLNVQNVSNFDNPILVCYLFGCVTVILIINAIIVYTVSFTLLTESLDKVYFAMESY